MNDGGAPHGGRFQYRPEIDGLRALAVLPVMLFHAGFKAFSGGYVGVDVFFVISGYLITSIIAVDLQNERFSVVTFYERRARRILPPLFLVMLICLPFAWLWMMPSQLVGFGRSLAAVAVFASNIFFWRTSGYFDAAAEEKPLLHTWSLGVEEQYYLFFPLFLMLFWRFGRRRVGWVIVAVAVASLAASEIGWRHGKAMANFFLLPSRAWELLIGSLVALASINRAIHSRVSPPVSQGLAAIGLVMIASSVFIFDSRTPFPSVWTLVPTGGTALVIAFADKHTAVARLLSLRWIVFVGLISYSAYLWHQPLLVFARIYGIENSKRAVYGTLMLLALLLAYLTWRFIEAPFRDRRRVSSRRIFVLGAVFSLLFIAVGGVLVGGKGFESRLPRELRYWAAYSDLDRNTAYVTRGFTALEGEFSGSSSRRLLIVGDSFAQDFFNAANEARLFKGWEVRTITIPTRCQLHLVKNDIKQHIAPSDWGLCERSADLASSLPRIHEANVVILAAAWQPWAAELLPETIENFRLSPEQRLFVVGRKSFGAVSMRKLMLTPLAQLDRARNPIDVDPLRANAIMRSVLPSDVFIDLYGLICGNATTCPLFTPEGKLISYDGGHLTRDGAVFVGQLLREHSQLQELAGSR